MKPSPLVPRLVALAFALAAGGVLVPACSLGEGKGDVTGDLDIPDCWAGSFNLNPDFFAGVPYRKTSFIIRIQNGGDYQTFSDGLSILVDDVNVIRNGLLGQKLAVALSPEVTPPGIPIKPNPDPARVHATLYLQRSCRVQNIALHAVEECIGDVTTDAAAAAAAADGGTTCGAQGLFDEAGARDANAPTDAAAPSPPSPATTIGRSWMKFTNLCNADPDEGDASNRLNDGEFELFLADPREVCPGGLGPPPRCRGHLKGSFKFYFQRGKPAQPFP